jgi:hypothetical protein
MSFVRFLSAAMLLVLWLAGAAFAQVSMNADVDRDQIALTEQVMLTVTISGEAKAVPQLPPLPDFATVSTGSQQNLVITQGQVSRTRTFTYTLVPRKTGELQIGPVTLASAKGKVATEPIAITVTQAAPARDPRGSRGTTPGTRATRPKDTEPFFVEAHVDKDTVYVGEQVTYTFSYYRSASLGESNSFTPPQTTGFISVDLPPQRKNTTSVNGETYSVVHVLTAMFPTRSGPTTIGPARLRVVPDVLSSLMGRDPFGWFGRSGSPLTSGEPRNLATKSIEVYVKPLPPVPRGRTFSGAVGTCDLATSIDEDSVGVGDPVTITWVISGQGRKDHVDAPRVEWPNGLETFPPTTAVETSTRNDVVSETKTFTIAVVPRHEGTIKIPAPELTFFDPELEQFKTIHGRQFSLRVGPPRAGVAVVAPTQTISAASSTIRYLKPPPTEWRQSGQSRRALWFSLLQLVPPVVVVAAYAWRRRNEAPEQRARGARTRAIRQARKRLAYARAVGDPRLIAQEVTGAFREFLAARFELSTGELLDTEWVTRLKANGCSERDADDALRLLQSADRARFGGGAHENGMSPETAMMLMERLDKCAH